jgi:putative phage-type endonuclease
MVNSVEEITYALNLVQGSEAWLAYKLGRVGASRIADITARLRNGSYGASRATYQGELIAERLTGVAQSTYVNSAMQWGTDNEPQARKAYRLKQFCLVEPVGIVLHQKIPNALASPDGLVDADGLVEIKCPHVSNNHIELLLGASIPGKYMQQMQWQLACTGRAWCDFVSYDPRMPDRMQIFIKRIERDSELIKSLEEEVEEFLNEIDARVASLRTKYDVQEAA